eukprot:TRINITY_DN4913_c0_g1_i1.p1 TRINITY_DN4913_c0_g1~~TRINITY_DN4913_c0_g1_i1.p1  ORF type:complete len:144 (+),score=32.68 TRINITY_DN4913_c0_g1_i1:618-1049(+)
MYCARERLVKHPVEHPVHAEYEDAVRPCSHNDWDDVRTRNGFKVLRCRICQGRWKLPSQSVPRCMEFLHNRCEAGPECVLLHVRRKKNNLLERYDQFGERVLAGVAHSVQKKARKHAARHSRSVSNSSSSSCDGPPKLLDEDV